jgi:hypothetical protein
MPKRRNKLRADGDIPETLWFLPRKIPSSGPMATRSVVRNPGPLVDAPRQGSVAVLPVAAEVQRIRWHWVQSFEPPVRLVLFRRAHRT